MIKIAKLKRKQKTKSKLAVGMNTHAKATFLNFTRENKILEQHQAAKGPLIFRNIECSNKWINFMTSFFYCN